MYRQEENKLHILTKELWQNRGECNGLITADVGTTTIAMALYGADGRPKDYFTAVNPQRAYGADVISRIRAAENPETAEELQQMILKSLEQGIKKFLAELSEGEQPYMVLAGNTTMIYLLMGWSPKELGQAPFWASRLDGGTMRIAGVPCFVFPGLSAFVGGDIVSGIYACRMTEQEKPMLFIDLGTNGEIVLGSKAGIYACATAAGPAFEGGPNRGIWGADMVSITAELLERGILDETGLLQEKYFETGVQLGQIHVTQRSIRAIQLAKAAIFAGIQILLQKADISIAEIDRVVLAGGFGYYLNPADAVRIGLLPKELLEKAYPGGNTALAGAHRAGVFWKKCSSCGASEELRAEIFPQGVKLQILNLAEVPEFQASYLEAVNFK